MVLKRGGCSRDRKGDGHQQHPTSLTKQCRRLNLPVESWVVRVFAGCVRWRSLKVQDVDLVWEKVWRLFQDLKSPTILIHVGTCSLCDAAALALETPLCCPTAPTVAHSGHHIVPSRRCSRWGPSLLAGRMHHGSWLLGTQK